MDEGSAVVTVSILFCLILAHVAADFLFQWEKIIKYRFDARRQKRLWGNALHSGTYLIATFFITFPWISTAVFWTVIFAACIHFLIDTIKSEIIKFKPKTRDSIGLFLGDQFVHLVSLLFLWVVLLKGDMQDLFIYFRRYTMGTDIPSEKIILAGLLFIVGLWGVGHFIKIYNCRLHYLTSKRKNEADKVIKFDIESELENGVYTGGFIIGLLERTFIMIAIVFGLPNETIGFALATKSIARFKKFDDDRFVEYFIIGTLISYISAIIIGKLIQRILFSPI
ncbi:MAG: DUF3307 domain-containing protein [Dehalobacterium sp.]